MRVYPFEQLLSDYAPEHLREGYDVERQRLLGKYPFSVLVEGAYFETDGLEKWIEQNLGPDQINWLFYIKTGYDFGFTEFFFTERLFADRVKHIVPLLYTRFPDSEPPGRTYKTNGGYEIMLEYDPKDPDAIIFDYSD